MRGIGARTLDAQDKRALLLDAAENTFCRLGYAQTTVAALAADAGITRPTVYAYYDSKDEVFRALADRVRTEFLRLQEEADTTTPVDTARSTLSALLEVLVRHHGMLTLIRHQALSDRSMRRLEKDLHARSNRRHARFLERLERDGQAELAIPAAELAEAITGAAGRFAELVAASPARARARRQRELAAELLALYLRLTGITPS